MKNKYQLSSYELALLQQGKSLASTEYEIAHTRIGDRKRLAALVAKRDRYSHRFAVVVDLYPTYKFTENDRSRDCLEVA
jgi:hypothetical protein